jgi:hypothetical protein
MDRLWTQYLEDESGESSQLLALGLFIMLLAFFIVLNSLSTFDEKTAAPVLASLERTFAPRVYRQDVGQTQVMAPAQGSQDGSSLERISGMFSARIPGTEVAREREGILHVRVPTRELFNAISALSVISEYDKDEFVAYRDIFVAVVAAQDTKQPLRMDFTVNLPSNPSDAEKGTKNLTAQTVKETSDMAAILQKNGLPLHLYSFAYRKGIRGKTNITFSPYETYDFTALTQGDQ